MHRIRLDLLAEQRNTSQKVPVNGNWKQFSAGSSSMKKKIIPSVVKAIYSIVFIKTLGFHPVFQLIQGTSVIIKPWNRRKVDTKSINVLVHVL